MSDKRKYTEICFSALICGLLLTGALIAALQYAHALTNVSYPILGYTILALILIGTLGLWRLTAKSCAIAFGRLPRNRADAARFLLCVAFGAAGMLLRMRVLFTAPTDAIGETGMLFAIARFSSSGTLPSNLLGSYTRYLALSPSAYAYPAHVVTAVVALFGESVRAILFVNLAFSAMNIALGCKLAGTIAGKPAMVPVSALLSLWPASILAAGTVTSMPYFTFLLLVSLTILTGFFRAAGDPARIERPNLTLALLVLCGVLIGYLPSVRPEGHAVALATAILMLFFRTPRLGAENNRSACVILSVRPMRFVLVALPMMLTMLILWQKLRMLLGQAPAFGLSELGYSFMVGMNAPAGGTWNQADADFYAQVSASFQSAFAAQWTFFRTGFARLIDDPAGALSLIASAKRLFVWQHGDLTLAGTVGFVRNYPVQILYAVSLAFATASAFLAALKRRDATKPLFAVLGMLLGYSILFEARIDEHALILPLILIVAGGYGALPERIWRADAQVNAARAQLPSHLLSEGDLRAGLQGSHLRITATRAFLDDREPSVFQDEAVRIVDEEGKETK